MLRPRGLLRAGQRALISLALVAALPAAASAQDPPPPWLEMTIFGVEPAGVDDFLAAQQELAAMEQAAGVPWRRVGRTAVFGDAYRFVILKPFTQFAAYARPGRADADRARVESRIERVVTSRESLALRATHDIDSPLPQDEEPALTLVQRVSVVPGKEQDYVRVMMEDVLPHFTEAEMHHSTGAITLGGEGGYVHFFHFDNFAALDQGSPMARALGPEAALEVMSKLAGAVSSTDQWLVRHLPELSFREETEEETPGH